MYFTEDLQMSALNLGPDLLSAYSRSFADIRDKATRDGLDNQAAFYNDLAVFCTDTRDHYNASLRNLEHDYLDSHIQVTAEQ